MLGALGVGHIQFLSPITNLAPLFPLTPTLSLWEREDFAAVY